MGGAMLLRCLTLTLLPFAAVLAFAWPVRRRSHYALRVGLCLGVAVVLAVAAWAGGALLLPFSPLQLTLAAALAVLQACVLCDQPLHASLYTAIWGLMTQQFCWQLFNALYALPAVALPWLALAPFTLLCGVPVYALVARRLPVGGRYRVGPRQTTSAVLIFLLFSFVAVGILRGYDSVLPLPQSALALMCEFYCLTILYLQNALFKNSAIQKELTTLDLLWHQQKEQYDLAKENIALINRKCHDLKHQVRALRDMADNDQRRKYLDEIDDSIRIYESIVKTGSEVLDTILTEKSLLCKEKDIQIHCVADGSRMGFLDPVDAYTIFGNAIDNAIEEVQKFADHDKRQIDVLIHVRQQFLVISITNPLTAAPSFRDGLPQTTKGNNGYHGFGLKSVQHTVGKYGGNLTIGTEDGCFTLKILFPLPQTAAAPA